MRIGIAAVLALLLPALAVVEVGAECVAGPPADTPFALVFSGGGAKGAWEAGVASAMAAAGLPIALAAGSSAGALNAVMLADGRLDVLETTWRTLSRDRVYFVRPGIALSGLLPGWATALAVGGARSLVDAGPLRDLLATSLDLSRVRGSSVQLVIVATDLVHRAARVFDNRTLTLDALLAATALPGVFPAVAVDGTLLVDGGLVARAPVLEALARSGVRRALVLVSYATAEQGRAPTSVRRALEESFETAMVHQIERDVELARLRHPDVDVQVLLPSAPLDLRPLDFEPDALARAYDRGLADGKVCADAWRR